MCDEEDIKQIDSRIKEFCTTLKEILNKNDPGKLMVYLNQARMAEKQQIHSPRGSAKTWVGH